MSTVKKTKIYRKETEKEKRIGERDGLINSISSLDSLMGFLNFSHDISRFSFSKFLKNISLTSLGRVKLLNLSSWRKKNLEVK